MYVGSSEDIINTLKVFPGNVTTIHANNGGFVVGNMVADYPNLTGGKGIATTENMHITKNVWFPIVYTNATGGAANMFVASDGRLSRTASSRKWKENERISTFETSNVLNLSPALFDYKDIVNDDEVVVGDKDCTGYIAEDSALFASLDKDGYPDGINWNLVAIATLEELKKLRLDFDAYKLSH